MNQDNWQKLKEEPLVAKVISKFTGGEVNMEEAASRLVGTGHFEENSDSLEFLRSVVCPELETRIAEIDEEIAKLQAESDRIRLHLGIPLGGNSKVAKKEKVPSKARKGAALDGEMFVKESDGSTIL